MPERCLLDCLLENYSASSLLGLEYIVEILVGRADPEYKCVMCRVNASINDVMDHLLSTSHKLAYLDKFFPSLSKTFISTLNKSKWDSPTYNSLESIINKIELEFKRGQPRVIASGVVWERDKFKIEDEIENGWHARY